MNSEQLAALLIQQATPEPHQIELNEEKLGTKGLGELLKTCLGRADGTLWLVVDPNKIDPHPPAGGFSLDAHVPTDEHRFLGLGGRVAKIEFVVGTTIDLVLTLLVEETGDPKKPATIAWKFSDSYPQLQGLAYDELELSKSRLVMSTGASGKPPKGLGFNGKLALSGVFQAAADLLQITGSPSYSLSGQITGTGEELGFSLGADFNLPIKNIGNVLELEKVGAGVDLISAKHDGAVDRLVQIYLCASVTVRGSDKPLEALASMPVFGGSLPSSVSLALVPPTGGLVTSLGDLASLLAGTNWGSFLPGPLRTLFENFGLKGYGTTWLLSSTSLPELSTMRLDVGTGEAFTLWDEYELTFDASWTVVFIGGSRLSYLLITADFTFGDKLEFLITVDSEMNITGQETKPLNFKLSELNGIFDNGLAIPDDLLKVKVENFGVAIQYTEKIFEFTALFDASFNLFGAQILALEHTGVAVIVNKSQQQKTSYVGRIEGIVSLGPISFQTDAVIASKGSKVPTVFTLHLVGETVGSMLGHLIHLVDPTYELSFPDPWDKLLEVSLDALVLEVDVTNGKVSLIYEKTIDLGFVKIETLTLSYTKGKAPKTASSTKVEIAGSFLGIEFGPGRSQPALAFDPVKENPPAPPGKGSKAFDLQYAGLGQHVAFSDPQPQTIGDVIKQLMKDMAPVPPGQTPGLKFSAESNWLIGAQFTVADTIAISAVFNDPNLYGVLIKLSGAKAKVFAGLSFEILYRKISDSLGVYHVELKLPDAMRNLQFGAASVTLPIVVLDIYTNGNFRVDFGFPKGLDFSRSFSFQLFPFIGYGGFYFALLNGATSTRVPQITNGTWSPVVEFGVGMSIGVGKTVDAGILKGGISVTVVGILEGVLAWFHPTEPAPTDTYYWFQGTIAVTGKLYATIDFAIIQASVDVTAYLSATLTIEAHKPIYIEASASVSVRVSVRIVFFTIHFSFDATVDASFTIGSASPTPWVLASKNGAASNGPARMLRGQQTLHSAAALRAGERRARRQALVAPAEPLTDWPAVRVLGPGPVTLPLTALVAFTKAESWAIDTATRDADTVTVKTKAVNDLDVGDLVTIAGAGDFDGTFQVASVTDRQTFAYASSGSSTSASQGTATAGRAAEAAAGVLLLSASNSISTSASTHAEHRQLAGGDPASEPFNRLMEAMLAWGVFAEGQRPIAAQGAVRTDGVATVTTTAPHGLAAGEEVIVAGVGDESFDGTFTVASVPSEDSFTYAQARLPDATSGGGGAATVTADSLERLRKQLQDPRTVEAAFGYETLTAFLAKNFVFEVTPGGDGDPGGTGEALFPVIPALSLADNQPQHPTGVDFGSFNPVGPDYAAEVRAYFQTLAVEFEAAKTADGGGGEGALGASSGPSMAMVVFGQYFNMLMSTGVRAAIDALASYAYTTGSSAMSIAQIAHAISDESLKDEPMRIVAPNQEKEVLSEGCKLELPDVVHQAGAGDTFATIAAALAGLGAQGADGQPYSAADLIAANAGAAVFVSGAAIEFKGLEWKTQAGETLELIAIRLLLRAAGPAFLTNVIGLGAGVEALQKLNPGIAPNESLTAGQVVAVAASATYTAVEGDTLTLVAAYGLAAQQGLLGIAEYVSALIAANPNLAQKDPTKPQPAGEAVQMPPVTRTTAPGDSVETIAATLLTTVAKVEDTLLALPAATPLLAPQATLHAPLHYPIQSKDTFAKIAAKFDLTLADAVAAQPLDTAMFAAAKEVVVADLETLGWSQLTQALLESGEWNKASAMVSRFMLSGLRLPDPHKLQGTGDDTLPPPPSAVRTKPLFALTGQQFAAPPAGGGYKLTLANAAGAPWLKLAESAKSFELGSEQARYLAEVATTKLEPGLLHPPTRLALYRMTPPRTALGQHVAWQAAVRPSGCLGAAPTTANPSIWRFPDALLTEIAQAPGQPPPGLLYQVVSANHGGGDSGAAAPVGCYAWGTIVDFTVSRPQVDGHADSVANAYVVEGSDDTGAALLHQVQKALEGGAKATLYLLRRPDQAGTNPSGVASDELLAEATYLLKTNLSTLTHSRMREQEAAVTTEAESGYAAKLDEAAKFVQLLWEASITRSGGFYLNYAAQGGGGLPASAFGDSSTAQLSLLVMLEDQAKTPTAPLQPFNNCVVIGDAIDTTQASVFAQPANCVVQAGDDLTTLAATLSRQWGASWSAVDLANLNAEVPQLLAVGGTLDVPGSDTGYTIGYGETLAGIAGHLSISVATLIETGGNATSKKILAAGAAMQLAAGVLRPATTVPPGTAGFEITRPNPDPGEAEWHQLTPKERMNLLFNLVGWALEEKGGFSASGDGLPTTPTDALRLAADGLTALDPDAAADANWYYTQSFAVSPFATTRHGSASPALPPAAANPYNGIGVDKQTGKLAEVTVALALQDIYGNRQPLDTEDEQAQVPVGYYDDLVGIGAWPSIAASYLVTGPPAAIELALSLQQASYIPSTSTPVPAALASIAADLKSYRAIYYQYVQPDVSLSIETTLALDPETNEPREPLSLPLPKPPLLQFVAGAWVYLSALATTEELVLTVSGSSTSVAGLVADYGVTAPQLFEANGEQPAASLFGGAELKVPWIYATAPGDDLKRIVKNHQSGEGNTGVPLAELARLNERVPLPEGSYVTVPSRPVAASADGSFAKTAADAKASVGQLAADNASRTDLLAAGATLYLGGASHPVAAGESLEAVATKLGSTPAEVAVANQSTPTVLIPGAQLQATDARVEAGDALAQLAETWTAGNLETLATLNEERPDLFAPATQIQVGSKPPAAAGEGETLATFAAHQKVTLAQLAAANKDSVLAAGAAVRMPGTLKPTDATKDTHSTCAAASGSKLADLAAKYGVTPANIVALNPDVPGLLEPQQPIKDSASGKTVTTEPDDSFGSIVARFGDLSPPVTVSLAQLAADVADQAGLLTAGGLWICPPFRADAGLQNPTYALADLVKTYGLDLGAFATANAATLGMIAAGVDLTPLGLNGKKTTANDTLNSLSNRTGGALTPVQVASALAASPLLAAGATILPVPPAAAEAAVEMTACLAATVSRLSTVVVTSRNSKLVDHDFTNSPAVAVAKSTLTPEVEAEAEGGDEPLRLKKFADDLETALPGLRVAVGDPEAEGDPASASTVWVANFGNPCGPKLEFKFEKKAEYFALPPLSRSLLAGTVEVPAYSSEQFPGPLRSMNFQAVDLDVWLNTFLEAVDLFLSPSYAVPAYALAPAAVTKVVAKKEKLAAALKARVDNVLKSGGGNPGDAQEALYQALLTRLSSASSINTLVQVPVKVPHGDDNAESAPRLSGKLGLTKSGEGDGEEVPSAYSFSTAKVPLSTGESSATFLFSVKSPGSQRAAQLDLQYDVVELELPEAGPASDGYRGSSWLQLVSPLDSAVIGKLDIPIPLRAYPSPVTLVSQEAKSPEKPPASAAEMLAWELEFVYQHEDAAQDTPLVEVSFNPAGGTQGFATPPAEDPVVEAVFRALAKFTTIWPALRNDLALLTLNPPGKPAPTAKAAVEAFATLVEWVAEAFEARAERLAATPPTKTYYWRLQKEESEEHLTALKLTAINPAEWSPGPNPTELWPTAIQVRYEGKVYPLTPGAHDKTSATYAYPAGVIPAGAQLAHSFCFDISGEGCKKPPLPSEEPGKQTFCFRGANILTDQSARAGVAIWRNLELIEGAVTAPKFIYQTPIGAFANNAVPSNTADTVPIGATGERVAAALGTFLEELFKGQSETFTIRLAGGYSYAVNELEGGSGLSALMPVFLIPSYEFDPATDPKVASGSFVCQVEAAIDAWQKAVEPSLANACYLFDLTVFAGAGGDHPLIHAPRLRYSL